jgi:hypothetical protein
MPSAPLRSFLATGEPAGWIGAPGWTEVEGMPYAAEMPRLAYPLVRTYRTAEAHGMLLTSRSRSSCRSAACRVANS